MKSTHPIEKFAPPFRGEDWSSDDIRHLSPFFTNLDRSVYVPLIFAPELIGPLCSRASRAPYDLRYIFLNEFIYPFVNPTRDEKDTEESWKEKLKYGESLKKLIGFLHEHPYLEIFSNPKARSFYVKWLAQYGDDSIAQMAGSHLVFTGISQVAIKHFEDQRIGLAPIEKSTRYVNYGQKINGKYLYYTDPTLDDLGLTAEYRAAMNGLFETYNKLLAPLIKWLSEKFPSEKPSVVEKKAFDTLRGLLPSSTLSQVAFFGNGQAFEHMMNRSMRHPLGEIRWAAENGYEELNKVTPSFLRRLKDEEKKEMVEEYQKYLAEKGKRIAPHVLTHVSGDGGFAVSPSYEPDVHLIEFDPEGEAKVITGILYSAPNNHRSWGEILEKAKKLNADEKGGIIEDYLHGRSQRWQKVGRAFENVYIRFEVVMNIGAWRDLHRHRMLTQQRQNFSCFHGYDIPPEIIEAGFESEFKSAIEPVGTLFAKIAAHNADLAQYSTTLAHRLRFMQWQNLRQCFWQNELRTIPEGHPDYRNVEQKKFKLLEKVYPLIAEHMKVNMGEYDFARRGQEEKNQKKMEKMS